MFLLGAPAVLKVVQSTEQRSRNRINSLICHYTGANLLIFRASRKSQAFLECTTSPSLTLSNWQSYQLSFSEALSPTAVSGFFHRRNQNVKVHSGLLGTLRCSVPSAHARGRERTAGGKQESWWCPGIPWDRRPLQLHSLTSPESFLKEKPAIDLGTHNFQDRSLSQNSFCHEFLNAL